jgi:hypothetical protein
LHGRSLRLGVGHAAPDQTDAGAGFPPAAGERLISQSFRRPARWLQPYIVAVLALRPASAVVGFCRGRYAELDVTSFTFGRDPLLYVGWNRHAGRGRRGKIPPSLASTRGSPAFIRCGSVSTSQITIDAQNIRWPGNASLERRPETARW